MWMRPTEQEDETEEDFAALLEQLAGDSPSPEPAPLMPDADVYPAVEPLPERAEPEPMASESLNTPLEPARDPFGLTPEEDLDDLSAFVAEQQQPPEPAFEPLYTDPAQHPIANPGERPELPEQRPSSVPDTPGPSPMWEKYSNQQAHMGSGAGGGLQALASRGGYGGAGGPPMAQDNTLMFGLAALADLGLNKGRNTGSLLGAMAQDTDYENYRRQMAHAKEVAGIQALANRGRYGSRGMDPLTYELRKQALDLRARGLETTEAREARLREKYEEEFNPDSATSARARELAVRGGLDPEMVRGQSAAQLAKLSPAVNDYLKNTGEIGDARTSRAAATAGAQARATMQPKIQTAEGIAAATQPFKLEQIEKSGEIRNRLEGQSPGFQLAKDEKYRAAADQYAKETEQYRGIAQQVKRALSVTDKYGGKDIPGLGWVQGTFVPDVYYGATNNKDALEIRNTQKFMNDIVLRAQTGAAAPMTEQVQIQIMTGSKPGATEAEFMTGLEAVRQYSTAQLRAFSAGKGDAAREVLQLHGVDDMVFPDASGGLESTTTGGDGGAPFTDYRPDQDPSRDRPRTRKAPRPRPPHAPSAGTGRTRNGKEVRAIKSATAPDGSRVRVVFYVDGSREVVQ